MTTKYAAEGTNPRRARLASVTNDECRMFFQPKGESDMEHMQLSNVELLERVIGSRGTKQLYQGSLHPLFAPKGSVNRYHERLAAARELVKRWLNEDLRNANVLSSPTLVRDYLRACFAGGEHERFIVLFLDSQNRLIVAEELFRGTLTQTSVYPREVVKRALHFNAAGVIFSHNHPSGVAEPSRADEALTRSLKEALSLVDVKVLDHLIVAGTGTLSFAERGLI
jgi:DNA repair protein RadC